MAEITPQILSASAIAKLRPVSSLPDAAFGALHYRCSPRLQASLINLTRSNYLASDGQQRLRTSGRVMLSVGVAAEVANWVAKRQRRQSVIRCHET
jgi:hypothetical protein